MATKIQASQISTSTSSWYQRLRAIQGKTLTTIRGSSYMAKSTDPAIAAGGKFTAAQMNAFISALNAVQSNPHLAYANWSSYKPSSVTQGSSVNTTTMTKINNMLTSLEHICSNYSTNSVNSTTPVCSYNSTQSTTCKTYANNSTCDDCDTYGESYDTYTDDGEFSYGLTEGYVTNNTYDACTDGCSQNYSYETGTDIDSPYGTDGHDGCNNYGNCYTYSTDDISCPHCVGNEVCSTDYTDSTGCDACSNEENCDTYSEDNNTYNQDPTSGNSTNYVTAASNSTYSFTASNTTNSTLSVVT